MNESHEVAESIPADSAAQLDEQGSPAFLVLIVLVATLGGLLFGYDTAVIAGAIGYLQTHFDLTPAGKGWAASSALAGCVLGVALCGPMSDRFGRRTTLLLAGVSFLVSAIGTAVPASFGMFVFFRLVGGIGVGAASMTSPMYIAEVAPRKTRGRLVSVNQLAIVSGMLVVYFVNYAITLHGNSVGPEWNTLCGWRWMFASEAIPAALFLLLLLFVPESPRWLAEQGRSGKAFRVLQRIGGHGHARDELAGIERILEREPGTWQELFGPGVRVAVLIGIALAVLQQVTGINVFLYYAPEIFKSISRSEVDVAMLQTVVVGAVNLTFTVLAIAVVDKFGRRPLMLIGACGMGVSLAAIGTAAMLDRLGPLILIFVLGYIACFAMSVGPVTWVILSEIFPNRLRGLAMGMSAFALWTANFVVSQTFPMMDKNVWLVDHFNHGFPFFVYAGFCVVLAIFVGFVVPETKGQSLEDIEQRWLNT